GQLVLSEIGLDYFGLTSVIHHRSVRAIAGTGTLVSDVDAEFRIGFINLKASCKNLWNRSFKPTKENSNAALFRVNELLVVNRPVSFESHSLFTNFAFKSSLSRLNLSGNRSLFPNCALNNQVDVKFGLFINGKTGSCNVETIPATYFTNQGRAFI